MKLSNVANRLVGQPMFQIRNKIKELQSRGKDVLRFEIGDSMDYTDRHIIEATAKSLVFPETRYTDSSGLPELKKLIRQDFLDTNGLYIEENQITVMPANSIVDFVVRCLCDKDNEVMIVTPAFPTYSSVCKYNGIKFVEVLPKDNFRLKAEELPITKNTKLLILNSPCNPSGVIIDKNELIKIFMLAEEHDFYILTDDTYLDIYYGEKPYSLAQLNGCTGRVISLNSFSKLFSMAGFRIGYCIAPEELSEKLGLMFQTIFSCMPVFIQKGACAALLIKDRFLPQRIKSLKEKRDLMVEGLNRNGLLDCNLPEGSTYCWVNVSKTGMTGDEFSDKLLEKEFVSVLPGSCFGEGLSKYIRLCFDTDLDIIKRGTDRINFFLNGRADGC